LIATGFTPESSVKAVLAEDFSILVHSGLVSVQLQPPGGPDPAGDPGADPAAADSGAVPEPDPAEAAQSDAALAGALDSIGA
jgi:hypothetical protein